uniref:uncharacterized protein LOC120336829 n=1 Tax=Styela clava TaxID=7725 RepID=UPI0019394673|nr:uncharacterized protein LOC120336829 [Styela clava]
MFTHCIGEKTRKYFYSTCYLWCNTNYMLSGFSTKVTCENGSFRPNHVCDLIPYKVDECENTNLDTCLYDPDQLADYWRRKEPPIDPDQIDDVDFDSFPQIISIVAGRTTSTEVSCIDKLIGFSYCARKKKTKKFAFNCKAFTKFPPKKLSKKNAEKKMNACFKCRAIDCTATVYI